MSARRVLAPLVVGMLFGLCSPALSARADEATPSVTTHADGLSAPPPVPSAAVVAPSAQAPSQDAVSAPSSVPSGTPASTLSAPPPPVTPPPPDSAPVEPSPAATVGPTADAIDSPAPVKRKKEPMDSFAFGLKVGVARVGPGNVNNPTYVKGAATLPADQLAKYGLVSTAGCDPIDKRCHTDARRGFHLAVPIQIGGSGVGFQVEPYLTIASAGSAYGVYLGPTFQFRVLDPLYVGFGLGLQAAYVKSDPWKYAGDLYGRVPINATYYVTDDLALVLEFAFGGGASAYFGEVRDIVNPTTGARIARKADVTFGFGKIWDLSVGVRFP